MSPYQVTADLERALCDYTGSTYAVALNSCTAALQLAVEWHGHRVVPLAVSIPCRTYVSVPMSIKHAGFAVTFRDEDWRGCYQLQPLPVWDCARRFTSQMYISGQFQCVSFAASKILGMEQGGAILHDDLKADAWFRRMRFDGRTEGVAPADDDIQEAGYHCIMLPSVAAQGLLRLYHLPLNNPDLPDYPYPDLSLKGFWK